MREEGHTQLYYLQNRNVFSYLAVIRVENTKTKHMGRATTRKSVFLKVAHASFYC